MSAAPPDAPKPRRRHPVWRALRLSYSVFFVLFAAFLFWLVRTEAGARLAVSKLGVLMPGSFAVERATGTLWSPLHLEGLTYETDTMRVTAKRADVTWRLSGLVRRRLDIVRLRAAGVRVETKPSARKDETVKLPDVHLPINLVVRDAEVRDVVIAGKQGKPDFPITSIALATSIARGEALHVDRLAVRAPSMTADVSGTVTPTGDYPVDLKLGWTLLHEKTTWRGAGHLTGTLAKLRVEHALEAPVRVGADVTVTDPFGRQELHGSVTLQQVALRTLRPDGPDVVLDGTVLLDGTVEKLHLAGSLTALAQTFSRADAAFDLTRDGDDVRVAKLDLRLPRTGTTASAKGSLTIGKAPKGDLDIAWTNGVWPLSGDPTVRSPRGTLRARGSMAAWEAKLGAALLVPQLKGEATITAEARGDEKSATFRTFTAVLLGGTITGSGAVTVRPDVAWDLRLEGNGLDPASFAPQLPGAIGFTATTRGGMRDGLAAQVAVANLSGTLKGQSLSGSLEASTARGEAEIRSLDVTLGGAVARAHGRVGKQLDVSFEAGVKNIGLFLPDAEGAFTVKGRATGTRGFPRIVAKGDGRGLVVSGRQAETLSVDLDVDLAPGGAMRADIAGTHLKLVGERFLDRATIGLQGTREQHGIGITTQTTTGRLDAHLEGTLERLGKSFGWRGKLDRLDAQTKVAGRWTLAGPARLAASAQEAELAGFCWTSGPSRLCADGRWTSAGPIRANATLAAIPIGLLSQLVPGDVQLTGRLDGTLGVEGDVKALTARTRLTVSGAELRYAGTGGRQGVTHIPAATLAADLGGSGLKVNADATLDGGSIHLDASAPAGAPRGLPGKASPLSGTVRVDLRDLSFLKAFDEDLGTVRGRIAADLRIGGTYGTPGAFGSATVDLPRVDLPARGLSVRDVKLALHASGTAATLDGSLRSGDGTLTMTGSTAFSGNAPTVLNVKGSRVTASWTESMKLLVSPDLTVTMTGPRIDATGSIEIPFSRIVYRKREGTVAVSKDVRYVDGPPVEPEKTREMHARLRLVLGEDVRFSGLGLDAQLHGSLLAIEEPGQATSGTGEVDVVSGTYTAYGRALTIDRARLVFAGGPLDDPGIDARASRTADDGTVAGLEIAGSVKQPVITLWSKPPMGQADILAYIVLGHRLDDSTSQEGNLVANAATSLGIKGANLLGRRIAARLGLEEVKIQTGDTLQEASLVVGKYLSPRLFVSYGIGLFDRVSRIRIDYHVSRHWTLRAEVGEGNSGDVLYTTGR